MKNLQKIQVDWDEVASIECDKCKVVYDKANWAEFQEILSIRFEGGFGSIFSDGNVYECQLCQHCTKELLGNYLRCVDCDDENSFTN